MSKTSGLVYAWRFISGKPLDGVRRSNSTFLRPGTRAIGQSWRDRPSRWMALPGWKRAAWRLGVTVPTVGNAVGVLVAPVPTFVADGTLTAALVTWGTYKVRRKVAARKHTKTWVSPLHKALCESLGIDPDADPSDYLDVPTDLHDNPDQTVRVMLPDRFDGDPIVKTRLAQIVKTKLALEDAKVSWHLSGERPYMEVKQAPKPPEKLTWESAVPLMEKAAESAPLIGLGKRGKTIAVDLDSDSPHILLSMSTGGGKSVFGRAMAAQILARGGTVVICDIKRVSHRWARGLPGVIYARSPEEIHDAIVMVAEEGARRFDLIDQDRDEEVAAMPRVLLIMEEMNATMGKLVRFWEAVREKDDPKKSPAIEAFGDILFMGRQARTHVLAVGQLMTARAMGGPEMRECFSTRVLARYSANAWRMLVPEVSPAPKSSRHPGRVQLVQAGEAHETQVVFGTEDQARDYVLTHRPAGAVTGVTGSQRADDLRNEGGTVTGRPPLRLVAEGERPNPFPGGDPNAPAGLRAICDKGLVTLSDTPAKTLAILRAARGRDPEFPLPVGEERGQKLYLPAEIIRWARNREKAVG